MVPRLLDDVERGGPYPFTVFPRRIMSKTILVLGGIGAALFYGHQQGMFTPNDELLNHRNENANAAAFRSADQQDALARYEQNLCTPYVGIATDQSGLPSGHVRVSDINIPQAGQPAFDHNGHLYPDGTVICNKMGQTAVIQGGVVTDIKVAGSSPEVVAYIRQWFDMNAGVR